MFTPIYCIIIDHDTAINLENAFVCGHFEALMREKKRGQNTG